MNLKFGAERLAEMERLAYYFRAGTVKDALTSEGYLIVLTSCFKAGLISDDVWRQIAKNHTCCHEAVKSSLLEQLAPRPTRTPKRGVK